MLCFLLPRVSILDGTLDSNGSQTGYRVVLQFFKEEIVIEIDSACYQRSIKMIDYSLQIFYYFNLSSVLVDCVQNVKR